LLSWEPIYAEIATSADLGYTAGPWEYRPKGAADTVVAYGNFVSIWKKLPTGWKVAIDVGIGNPKPPKPKPALRMVTPTGTAANGVKVQANPQSGRASLMKADQDFSKAARKNGLTTAYLANFADDVLFFRDELAPMTGKEPVRTFLNHRNEEAAWNPMRAEVSNAGDLGYTYGAIEANRAGESEKTLSYYLRIWRRQADGNWKVVLDIENPAPLGSKKPKE
jgi:ketosteroid isomerase-like protein